MWHLIAGLSASALLLYLSEQLYCLLGSRYKSAKQIHTIGGIAFLPVFFASLQAFQHWTVPLLILSVFLLSFRYHISWARRIAGLLLLLALYGGAKWISVRLLMAGLGASAKQFAAMAQESPLLFWACRIWAAFLALLLVRLPGLSRKRRAMFETRQLPALSLAFPAVSCLIVFTMANTARVQNGVQTVLFFLVYWMLFLANVFLIDLMERVTVSRLKEREQDLARKTLELESARYQQILRQHSETARLTHDLRNQLAVGVRLLQEGEPQEAYRMIEKIIRTAGEASYEHISGNAVVDAILDTKRGQMEELDITLFPHIVMPEVCAVAHEDLAVLMGSLLDNAVTACADISAAQTRYIQLTVRQFLDYLCVQIKHPSPAFAPAVSEEREAEAYAAVHGFNLASIRLVAKKYNGNVKLQSESSSFIITVLLTNPMPEA